MIFTHPETKSQLLSPQQQESLCINSNKEDREGSSSFLLIDHCISVSSQKRRLLVNKIWPRQPSFFFPLVIFSCACVRVCVCWL